MAFDKSGNLFIANAGDNNIEEFDQWNRGSLRNLGCAQPRSPAFDSSGNLYVANYSNNTIEKFNSFGQGSVFTSTNLLSGPIGLAFDSSGNLYVGNHFDGDILEFNSDGIGSVFAYGLEDAANYIAIEVPEPSSFLLATLGGLSLIALLKRKRP